MPMRRAHARCQRRRTHVWRRRRIELGQDRLERVEPRGQRVTGVFERLLQVLGERGGLFVAQIESHARNVGPLTMAEKLALGLDPIDGGDVATVLVPGQVG